MNIWWFLLIVLGATVAWTVLKIIGISLYVVVKEFWEDRKKGLDKNALIIGLLIIIIILLLKR